MKQFNDNASAEKGFYKLSWLQRIGFGSGDLAQNLIFQTTLTSTVSTPLTCR